MNKEEEAKLDKALKDIEHYMTRVTLDNAELEAKLKVARDGIVELEMKSRKIDDGELRLWFGDKTYEIMRNSKVN